MKYWLPRMYRHCITICFIIRNDTLHMESRLKQISKWYNGSLHHIRSGIQYNESKYGFNGSFYTGLHILTLENALLLGLLMSVFPALMQPTIEEVTGDDSLALGHFGSGCYWLSAQIGNNETIPPTKEQKNPIKTALGANGNTIGQSSAGFAFGTPASHYL